MIRIYIVFLGLFFLVSIFINNIHSKNQERDIEDIYLKKSNDSWGNLFDLLFDRNEFNKSYALIIGIGDYNHFPRLEAPYQDALRMREFLIKEANFDYVITLTNQKASKEKINSLMEDTFPRLLTKNDRFLFYFSGHGTQRRIGDINLGYLPLKNSKENFYGNMISMEDIERWDKIIHRTKHVLFVLDCCFSGLAGMQKKSPLTDKKLDRLSQYAHHLITAGTANEESVASLKDWGGSLFTDSFLKATLGRADLSSSDYQRDGVVSLKELMKYIGDRIDDESVKLKSKDILSKGIKMSPQISDLQDNSGEFFFITKDIKNQKLGEQQDKISFYDLPVETKGKTDVKQINYITDRPEQFQDKLITISGNVDAVINLPILGIHVYSLDDGTGKIWVEPFGDDTPNEGDRVKVTGIIKVLHKISGRTFGVILLEKEKK